MSIIKSWNQTKIVRKREVSIFAKKRHMLLGTKLKHTKMPADAWIDEEKFIKQSVSIPFKNDVRKPQKIILIGGPRIGKSTLLSCMIDDLQNDFNVPTLTIYPKGKDAKFHNLKGKGKILCPGEHSRSLKNRLLMPQYKEDDVPSTDQQGMEKFAFRLDDFNPNSEPGFMEENRADYEKAGKGVYVYLSILYNTYPELRGVSAKKLLDDLDQYVYTKKKGKDYQDYSDKLYIPNATYEALRTRLMGCISKKFLYDSELRVDEEMFIRDWNNGKSHAVIYFSNLSDPRTQSYSAKVIQTVQKAKRRDNIARKKKGLPERSIWLIVDDAKAIIDRSMDPDKYRAREVIDECLYMYGEDGWNILLVYHSIDQVPRDYLDQADFIICSRLGRFDLKKLTNERLEMFARNLKVKGGTFYNEWAVGTKDGEARTFFAIDSRVGLR
jgi:hypothetical protein